MNKVGEFMSTTLFSISPGKYAHEAIDEMDRNNISALFVEKEGEYIGIITKMDWMILYTRGECDPNLVKVADLMTPIVNTLDVDRTIVDAATIFEKKGVRHIPITRDGKIAGMFSVKDLEKYYLKLHKKTDF